MESPLFTAEKIMTADVMTVRPDTTIAEVARVLEHHRISGLPVVDAEKNLLGLITEYDLLQSIVGLKMEGTVADFMTTDVKTVDENATLIELVEMFLHHDVRRLPVTRDGKLLGIISRRDLVFAGSIRQTLLGSLPNLALSEQDAVVV